MFSGTLFLSDFGSHIVENITIGCEDHSGFTSAEIGKNSPSKLLQILIILAFNTRVEDRILIFGKFVQKRRFPNPAPPIKNQHLKILRSIHPLQRIQLPLTSDEHCHDVLLFTNLYITNL